MGLLYAASDKLYPERFKRIYEHVSATYPITVGETEYTWILFQKLFTERITGLALYNISNEREEAEPSLLHDMLVALYGYFCVFNREFTARIPELLANYEEFWNDAEREAAVVRAELRQFRPLMPPFMFDALERTLDSVAQGRSAEAPLHGFLRKYDGIVAEIAEQARKVPVRILIQFFEDLNRYHDTVSTVVAAVAANAQDYTIAAMQADLADSYKKTATRIAKFAWNYVEHVKRMKTYEQFPYVAEIIDNHFRESVLTPYVNIVRNPGGAESLPPLI